MKGNRSSSVSGVGLPLRTCLSLLAVSAVATALPASAQFNIGPNPTPSLISYADNILQDPYDRGEPAWFFGNSHNPISISYNSLAGVWQRQVSGAGSLGQNQEVDLLDYIKVGANSPWADWHETIATPDFVWGTAADDTFYTINGGARQYTGISYSPDKTALIIAFPTDLPVGANIVLHHEVQYMGADCFNNNAVPIVLDQYVAAVPEPSTLAVLGLEGACRDSSPAQVTSDRA